MIDMEENSNSHAPMREVNYKLRSSDQQQSCGKIEKNQVKIFHSISIKININYLTVKI